MNRFNLPPCHKPGPKLNIILLSIMQVETRLALMVCGGGFQENKIRGLIKKMFAINVLRRIFKPFFSE